MSELPAEVGSYALWLRKSMPEQIAVGRLGVFVFPAGDYLYLGSAHGSGGLRSRVERHFVRTKKNHWHIDYLRQNALVIGSFFVVTPQKMECLWSQSLVRKPGGLILFAGFGSQDCNKGCKAHLVYFSDSLDKNTLYDWLKQTGDVVRLTPLDDSRGKP